MAQVTVHEETLAELVRITEAAQRINPDVTVAHVIDEMIDVTAVDYKARNSLANNEEFLSDVAEGV